MIRRPGYREALEWLALNDDNAWLDEEEGLSVTGALVADLWGVGTDRLCADLRRTLAQAGRQP